MITRIFWQVVAALTGIVGWLAFRKERQQTDRVENKLQALAHIASGVVTPENVDDFLGQVSRIIAEQMQAFWAVLFLYDFDADQLVARVTYHEGEIVTPDQLSRAPFEPLPAGDVPLWRELVYTLQPIVVEEVATDRRLKFREALAAQGVRTLLLVPLRVEDKILGWFSLRTRAPRRYSAVELELAQAMAQQATQAVLLAQLSETPQALHPEALRQNSLPDALQHEVRALTDGNPMTVHMETPAIFPTLPPEAEADLLRIAQEAVINVVKHARARNLYVQLRYDMDSVELRVHDDGHGFDPSALKISGREAGIEAMRERMMRHGGTLSLESKPGKGTELVARLPRVKYSSA